MKKPLAAIKITDPGIHGYFLKKLKEKSTQNPPRSDLQVIGYLYQNEINFEIIIIRSHEKTL